MFTGYIDEVRVSNAGRYSGSTYTVPTAAFVVTAQSYAAGPYYVATTAASRIDLSAFDTIAAATVTATVPANTALKFLVSFDGGATWKSNVSGSAWSAATLSAANIDNSGMTPAQLQTALATWTPSMGATLDIAASFKTSDTTVTPTLDNVLVTAGQYNQLTPGVDYSVTKQQHGAQVLTFKPKTGRSAFYELTLAA